MDIQFYWFASTEDLKGTLPERVIDLFNNEERRILEDRWNRVISGNHPDKGSRGHASIVDVRTMWPLQTGQVFTINMASFGDAMKMKVVLDLQWALATTSRVFRPYATA